MVVGADMERLTDIWHPLKACIFITRKCNLRCSYCGVVTRDPREPELDFEGWKKVFDTTSKLGVGMHVIFGGEPMFRQDIKQIVNHLNENALPYAFISNATYPLKKYKELNLKQISCSVDLIKDFNTKEHNQLKSQRGTKLLLKLAKEVPDALANMGLCSWNLRLVPDIIKFFSDNKIWVITTPLHDDPKGRDFWLYRCKFAHPNRILSEQQKDIDWYCEQVLELKHQGYLIHQFDNFFNHYLPTHGVGLNWHCKIPSHLSIDSDGSLMCCIDFRGERVGNYKVWDLLNPEKLKQFVLDFKEDTQGCPGCCWDHIIESEHMYTEDPDRGKKSFQHGKSYC